MKRPRFDKDESIDSNSEAHHSPLTTTAKDGQTDGSPKRDLFSTNPFKLTPYFYKKNKRKRIKEKKVSEPSVRPSHDVVVEDYLKVAEFLSGHLLSNSVYKKTNRQILDGTLKPVKRLSKFPKCNFAPKSKKAKPGLFVTKQVMIADHDDPWAKQVAAESYSTFVIEYDKESMTQEEQIAAFNQSKIPYSLLVSSGRLSVHCVIKLNRKISRTEHIALASKLLMVFPESDERMLGNPDQFFRYPVDNDAYKQPLLDFKGEVDLDKFKNWLDNAVDEVYEKNHVKHSATKVEDRCQDALIDFINKNGGGDRFECPVCEKKGRGDGRCLSIEKMIDGSYRFHCFRCANNEKDYKQLFAHFSASAPSSSAKSKVGIFEIHDEMLCFASTGHTYHAKYGVWYEPSLKNSLILKPSDHIEWDKKIWNEYERLCRSKGVKFSEKNFSEIHSYLERRCASNLFESDQGKIALCDGNVIDLHDIRDVKKLLLPTPYSLPITIENWLTPPKTPIFDKFLSEHANDEDQKCLKRMFGFIFSNHSIGTQQTMLVIYGPSDTGKSQLLYFLQFVMRNYCFLGSVSELLKSPVMASNIAGKRLCISSENTIRASDSQRFRAAISGEQIRIKRLYRGEMSISHNAVFVSATNNHGFIEDAPENRKRVRVIIWNNPIPKEKFDFGFLEKLKKEAAGIIAKCLQEYAQFIDAVIPQTKSSDVYFKRSAISSNLVAMWLQTRGIKGGDCFNSTSDIYRIFQSDTNTRSMPMNEFGRKLSSALGGDFSGKSTTRGFKLNVFLPKLVVPGSIASEIVTNDFTN